MYTKIKKKIGITIVKKEFSKGKVFILYSMAHL